LKQPCAVDRTKPNQGLKTMHIVTVQWGKLETFKTEPLFQATNSLSPNNEECEFEADVRLKMLTGHLNPFTT